MVRPVIRGVDRNLPVFFETLGFLEYNNEETVCFSIRPDRVVEGLSPVFQSDEWITLQFLTQCPQDTRDFFNVSRVTDFAVRYFYSHKTRTNDPAVYYGYVVVAQLPTIFHGQRSEYLDNVAFCQGEILVNWEIVDADFVDFNDYYLKFCPITTDFVPNFIKLKEQTRFSLQELVHDLNQRCNRKNVCISTSPDPTELYREFCRWYYEVFPDQRRQNQKRANFLNFGVHKLLNDFCSKIKAGRSDGKKSKEKERDDQISNLSIHGDPKSVSPSVARSSTSDFASSQRDPDSRSSDVHYQEIGLDSLPEYKNSHSPASATADHASNKEIPVLRLGRNPKSEFELEEHTKPETDNIKDSRFGIGNRAQNPNSNQSGDKSEKLSKPEFNISNRRGADNEHNTTFFHKRLSPGPSSSSVYPDRTGGSTNPKSYVDVVDRKPECTTKKLIENQLFYSEKPKYSSSQTALKLHHSFEIFDSYASPRKDEFNVLLIGPSGTGKSTLINSMVNYFKYDKLADAAGQELLSVLPCNFEVQDDDYDVHTIVLGEDKNEHFNDVGQSVTQVPQVHQLRNGDLTLNLIDTPGLRDTRGVDQDDNNLEAIREAVRRAGTLHAICFVLLPNEAKMGAGLELVFRKLLSLFSVDAFPNVCFFFTNSCGTLFRPGDSIQPIRRLQAAVKSERRADLPFGKENVFCVDSDAFRYLVIKKVRPELSYGKFEAFEYNWNKSRDAVLKFISHLKGIKPFQQQKRYSKWNY